MMRADLTEKILDIKRERMELAISDQIGGMSEVLIVGALLGQMKLVKPLAKKAARLFGLRRRGAMLNEVPSSRHADAADRPAALSVLRAGHGQRPGLKALIEEEFGDGIMSAIDFDLALERLAEPKGDRVKITMSGNSCPINITARAGIPEYGYKEESWFVFRGSASDTKLVGASFALGAALSTAQKASGICGRG